MGSMSINLMSPDLPIDNLDQVVRFLDEQRDNDQWVSGVSVMVDRTISFNFSANPQEMEPARPNPGAQRHIDLGEPQGTSVIFIKPHAIAQRGTLIADQSQKKDVVTEVIRGIKDAGLKIVAAKIADYDRDMIMTHYENIPAKFQQQNADDFL